MRNLLMLLSALLTASLLLGAATGCDFSESEPQDAVLVNRAEEPIVYNLGGHPTGPPTMPFEVDLSDSSDLGSYVLLSEGDSAVLGNCNTHERFEDKNLFFFEVLDLSEDKKKATIVETGGVSSEQLINRFRNNNCRVVIDSLS